MYKTRTFKLETFYVDRPLYNQLKHIRKPNSYRARSKIKKKVSSLLNEVMKKKQNYSFVTFSVDTAENDFYAINLSYLKEFNPAFHAHLTIFCKHNSFQIIEKDTDSYWTTYINYDKANDSFGEAMLTNERPDEDILHFNNEFHYYLKLIELT